MKIVLLIVLIFTVLCLPYTKLQYYYLILISFLLVAIVALLPLNIRFKIIIGLILFVIYQRTLMIVFKIFKNLYYIGTQHPPEKRNDDTIVRKITNNLFDKYFKYNHNFYKLPSHPTIFIANYVSDRIENISCIMLPARLCIVMGSGFIDNFKFDRIIKHVHGTYKQAGEYNEVKNALLHKLKEGISIFSYSTRPFIKDRIGKVRSGMFRIAKELNTTVTPVYFDHIEHSYGVIHEQKYNIVVGDTFKVDDINFGVYRVKKFFKDTRKRIKRGKFLV